MPCLSAAYTRELHQYLTLKSKKSRQSLHQNRADTIIVLDNYSIHKSYQVRAQKRERQSLGLYLFVLPTYSPEQNLIEGE